MPDLILHNTETEFLLWVEPGCGPMGRSKQATRDRRREYCPKAFNKGRKTKTSPEREKAKISGRVLRGVTLPTADRGCMERR